MQLNNIYEELSVEEKRRKLEQLRLIDKRIVGDLDQRECLDATEYICEFERVMVLHQGKGYRKFVRWKYKTRLKDLLSVRSLKRIWKYFGRLFVKFKEKDEFIRKAECLLLSLEPQSEWMLSSSLLKVQSPYRGHTVETQYRISRQLQPQFPQLWFEQKRKSVELPQEKVGKKLQWTIIRKLSR
jgi:hypothetical protein